MDVLAQLWADDAYIPRVRSLHYPDMKSSENMQFQSLVVVSFSCIPRADRQATPAQADARDSSIALMHGHHIPKMVSATKASVHVLHGAPVAGKWEA
jgi:hypothetical protein